MEDEKDELLDEMGNEKDELLDKMDEPEYHEMGMFYLIDEIDCEAYSICGHVATLLEADLARAR